MTGLLGPPEPELYSQVDLLVGFLQLDLVEPNQNFIPYTGIGDTHEGESPAIIEQIELKHGPRLKTLDALTIFSTKELIQVLADVRLAGGINVHVNVANRRSGLIRVSGLTALVDLEPDLPDRVVLSKWIDGLVV